MGRLSIVGLLLIVLASPCHAAADELVIEDLAWLSGLWAAGDGDQRREEHSMRPAGGVIVGMSRSQRPNKPPLVEFIRIAPGPDGRLAYHATPLGQATTAFTVTESATNFVVFANPEHDFPQSITYRRDGDTLTAMIEGPGPEAKPKRFAWTWRLVGAAP